MSCAIGKFILATPHGPLSAAASHFMQQVCWRNMPPVFAPFSAVSRRTSCKRASNGPTIDHNNNDNNDNSTIATWAAASATTENSGNNSSRKNSRNSSRSISRNSNCSCGCKARQVLDSRCWDAKKVSASWDCLFKSRPHEHKPWFVSWNPLKSGAF